VSTTGQTNSLVRSSITFVLGGDKICLITDVKAADYHGTITMYRTGNAAGNNGPTTLVTKGNNRWAVYLDTFLEGEGCAQGPTSIS